MEKVSVSTFRNRMTQYLKKVQKGQVVTITSRGQSVAKIVPVNEENKAKKSKDMLRELGKNAVIGDILSPISEDWKAMESES